MLKDVAANKAAIQTLNGDASTAGSVSKKIADAIAAENLGQYATDGDLSTLARRVTTVEDDLNTADTGLKARMTAVEEELKEKVGDESVQEQIDGALKVKVDGVDVDKYALATDLAAAKQTHAADKLALEDAIAKKANDADLKAVAKSGLINDLSIAEGTVLVFDCGTSAV